MLETGYTVPVPRVERREALHFMGWHGSALDEMLIRQMDEAEAELSHAVKPRVIIRKFGYDAGMNRLEGTAYMPGGKDIRRLLEECCSVVLIAATLGDAPDRLVRRKMLTDGGAGFVMDAVASAMIETVCNEEERKLSRQASREGLFLTDRFSPGYGDMPLADGRIVCEVLDTGKRIGLTVSGSGIMLPQKSVTALIGISRKAQNHRPNACAVCQSRDTCALAERR